MYKPSTRHLEKHQGDIARYRDAVSRSSGGRFGAIWWGVFDHYVSLNNNTTVVDLGTGPALLLEALRRRNAQMRLVGIEMQPVMLAAAKDTAARCGAEIVEADLGDILPLSSDSADVVTSVMCLHELLYPPLMLAEARRILRPGGRLVLYDWVKRPLRTYLGDMNAALSTSSLQHYREHCLFSPDDLAFLIGDAGFEIYEVIGRKSGNFAMVVAGV